VASFQDEEGTFLSCLGSRAFCGEISADDIDRARNGDGECLRQVIRAHGLADAAPARLMPGRYEAFLEAHIEQGPRLEAAGRRIGVVTGIIGVRRFRVRFDGQADHAGTTPMALRRDAGAALIAFAHQLGADIARMAGPDTVWNFGRVGFEPGAANVVPGGAELIVEFRDASGELLEVLEQRVETLVGEANGAGPVAVAATKLDALQPTALDRGLGERIAAAAAAHGTEPLWMPSGAGHDAQVLAGHLPSAMLFIPSIGGRSHDVAEDTHEADIALGCRVLATAVADVLSS
jgi:N-carbamoyl-L-amino-acid hydrolase